MSERAEIAVAREIRGARAYWVLLGLGAGLIAGAFARGAGDGLREPALAAATMVGGLWLDALQMTVIPLIVALLVTGVAQGAEAARSGRIARTAVIWFLVICTSSAVLGALVMPVLLDIFPLSANSAGALRVGLSSIDPGATSGPVPAVADFFREIIPENVVEAAANGDVLPLVLFALLFGLALTRIDTARRRSIIGLFEAIADALLVVISWVLRIAPLGVFALAFAVGAGAGGAAFAGLAHYILLVSLLGLMVALAAYGVATLAGGFSLGAFARGMIAPQAVAISTQSSLASLPAMLAASRNIGVKQQVADVTLPLAVALFRATGPAMNMGVAVYIAHWLGLEISIANLIAATAVAAVVSYGAVSLPGQVSFFTSIAPIAMALGVPVAPLGLLVAVEMIPDIIRTVGNVNMDVAVTAAVNRSATDEAPEH